MLSGGCFCSAVTYEVDGELCKGRACHCSKCRRVFSGASSVYAELVPGSRFRWTTGEELLSTYSSAEGWAVGFCSRCGSTLCGLFEGAVHGLTLGSVSGDPGVEIEMHLFMGSKAPWDHVGGDAPKYEEYPP